MAGADVAVVVGPTAAGKSAIAMRLASVGVPVTIVSADSRQVYRGFDVGTAKPDAADRARVPHAGIDVVEPTARHSAYDWAALADVAIEAARAAGRVPLVVGGTGLYLRTLFEARFDEPPLDAARRSSLAAHLDGLPTEELRRWCAALDPARAHLGRVQLLRALEIALLAGQRLSDLHRSQRRASRWRPRYLVVDPGVVLADRIVERAGTMLAGPWQDEVRALASWVPPEAPAWKASGYRVVRALVEGTLPHGVALERVIVETRQYAKRQRTWFRHQLPPDVLRVDPRAAGGEDAIRRWWDERVEAQLA